VRVSWPLILQPFTHCDEDQDVSCVFELPVAPLAARTWRCQARTISSASSASSRPPVQPPALVLGSPGFQEVARVEVVLEPLPLAERQRLLAAGWKADQG
jgi:hypothetical protein